MNSTYEMIYLLKDLFSCYSDGYDLIWEDKYQCSLCIPIRIPLSMYNDRALLDRFIKHVTFCEVKSIDYSTLSFGLLSDKVQGTVKISPYHSYYVLTAVLQSNCSSSRNNDYKNVSSLV